MWWAFWETQVEWYLLVAYAGHDWCDSVFMASLAVEESSIRRECDETLIGLGRFSLEDVLLI